ncbi:MAG TPA: alpha/beta hydrolase [Segeticoccus sp.]|uniref:alpha/beta hydrolase n=1 Tax=Segeticoccus sp. TaxID=2706531 RepID=UPI002D805AF9|nr:alpha/beta hydrolase [Segeticoccus sp.]HET8602135.1 alpha/beta hydrolase [Segeticoccus sp.]
MSGAQLTSVTAPAGARGVVLVLHGGAEDSRAPVPGWGPAVLRMVPVARDLARRSRGQLVVARLRFAVRGWNGADRAPVGDTVAALTELTRRHPGLPVALVGHSMGGRAAVHAAGAEGVRCVVALAPWLTGEDPVAQLDGRRLLIAHGTADRITSAGESRRYADRARAAGVEVTYAVVEGGEHTMLWRAPRWHRLTTDFVLESLLPGCA